MIQYCTNNGAIAPLTDAPVSYASDRRPLAPTSADRRGHAEQMVMKMRECLERSLKQWTTSPSSTAVSTDASVTHRDQVNDGCHADNMPPILVYQSTNAAVIQISGTLQQQRKLESNGHSSRFIVSPTPNAMPATTVASRRDAAEPLSVIVPSAWTIVSCNGGGGSHRRGCELLPSLKISTGPTSPIFTTTGSSIHVHNHEPNSAAASGVGFVAKTTGIIVSSSSSSPTNSLDSGVSSPAAYGSVFVGDDQFGHHFHSHHHHIHYNFHGNGTPLSPSAGDFHVRHHYRSGCSQAALAVSDARHFQFGQTASTVAVSYTTRARSASVTDATRLLQYSPLCVVCGYGCDGVRALLEDGLRLSDDDGGACRRSTLSPLCESPRDCDVAMDSTTADDSGPQKDADQENDEDNESENAKTLMATAVDASHVSILPRLSPDDDVFMGRRPVDSAAENSAASSRNGIVDSFESNGVSVVRCVCAMPTPLSSVTSFTSPQIISCSAPTTPTAFSSSFGDRRATGCCTTTTMMAALASASMGRGHSTSSVNRCLKGILKKPPTFDTACGGALRGRAGASRGRFRLLRSVSECAADDSAAAGGRIAYAFNAMDLNCGDRHASSDVELMEMEAEEEAVEEEDESSRSSWENGGVSPPAFAYAGGFDASRLTLDGSDSSSMNAESADEKIAAELVPRKKRVSFSEHVQARIYRSSASILGQRKKNDKRNRTKRRRAESEGDTSHDDFDEDSHDGQSIGEQPPNYKNDDDADNGPPFDAACGPTRAKGAPPSLSPVCDSCRKPIRVVTATADSLQQNGLAARRDSGIDDDYSTFNSEKPKAVAIVGATETAVVVRGLSAWRRVCAECDACGATDAQTAKRVRRLVSTDLALGDENAPLVTTAH